jgi:putative ATPase
MDLFSVQEQINAKTTPLAAQLRPKNLDEFLGQEKFFSKYSSLLKKFQQGHLLSLILWGPPGCGKTSFVKALTSQLKGVHVIEENAIDLGAKKMKEIGESARYLRRTQNQQTLLFIDEIHRLTRSQQDVLLPYVEAGDLVLIGATTENPSYELNSALMSRSRLIVFEALPEKAMLALIEKAFTSENLSVAELMTDGFLQKLVLAAGGDGRKLLNSIEEIFLLRGSQTVEFPLQETDFEKLNFHQGVRYDKDRDEHYDTISAFIKSLRGSDPDAAIYYLARMLEGGEDPVFIARRLVILASEDIGNADPQALTLAVSAFKAVEVIGLPEARINLAQAVTYLASAPKSNRSYLAINKAQEIVRQSGALPIPLALRSAQTKLAKNIGYGKDYHYAHEGAKGWVPQEFLPTELKNEKFYEPSERGFEKRIKEFLEWLKK